MLLDTDGSDGKEGIQQSHEEFDEVLHRFLSRELGFSAIRLLPFYCPERPGSGSDDVGWERNQHRSSTFCPGW
jgi:hypothetical protein